MIKVLLIEDNPNDAILARKSVEGELIELTIISTREELLDSVRRPFDVCLLDMDLPAFTGEEAIKVIRENQPSLPIVIYSGSISQEQAAAIVRSGIVVDMLEKSAWLRLPGVIKRAYRERRSALALEGAERTNNSNQFAAGIVHDWAGCIQPAAMLLEILRPFVPPEYIRQHTMALECLNRGRVLQRQLMMTLRGSAIIYKPVSLDLVLRNTVEFIQLTFPKEIKLEFTIAKGLPTIQGDEVGLFQVMINLAANAQDALNGSGKITIIAQPADLWDVKIPDCNAVLSGKWAVICLKDDGPGMSREIAMQCWSPFFTTKPVGKGTGLGLPKSRDIIQRHGGYIDLKTEPGKGAEFTIYLPFPVEKSS